MALQMDVVLLLSVLFLVCSGSGTFDKMLDDVSPCVDVCLKNFSTENNEKITLEDSCRRGCRLFSIMEFIYQDNLTQTRDVCKSSCQEAYNKTDTLDACNLGCVSQEPFSVDNEEDDVMVSTIHILYPFQRVHEMYSDMFDSVCNQMSLSWSFYMEESDGRVIFMKSVNYDPVFETLMMGKPDEEDVKTSNYFEINIEAQDHSATPMLKNSQMGPLHFENDDVINLSKRDLDTQTPSDWMSCVAMKTGLPRLFISALILLCAVFMIWLCLTAIITSPEQKVTSDTKKLSINGDWEYIKELRALGQLTFPHASVHKEKLPIDISVERI